MVLQFGPFTLNVARRTLSRDDRGIHLTPKAFELIEFLAAEAPRVITKNEIHERLWPAAFVSDANLTGLIKELRRGLDDREREARVIRTIHGIGYAIDLPVIGRQPNDTAPLHWLALHGRRVPLVYGENIVGRDPRAHVWLDSAVVSRHHARIVVNGSDVRLEDSGSKNGTTVHDKAVRQPVVLRDGDRLSFGTIAAVYRSSVEAMSTQTQARSRDRS